MLFACVVCVPVSSKFVFFLLSIQKVRLHKSYFFLFVWAVIKSDRWNKPFSALSVCSRKSIRCNICSQHENDRKNYSQKRNIYANSVINLRTIQYAAWHSHVLSNPLKCPSSDLPFYVRTRMQYFMPNPGVVLMQHAFLLIRCNKNENYHHQIVWKCAHGRTAEK